MKTYIKFSLFLICLLFSIYAKAQVGIGTITPKALLDVRALDLNNPSGTDGFLIPRVSNLAFSLSAEQNGSMVHLTQDLKIIEDYVTRKYSAGLQQWNSKLRDGRGDWMSFSTGTRKTTAVDGWERGTDDVSAKTLTTVGCLSVRLANSGRNNVDVQIRSNCGSQEEAHYTIIEGYGPGTLDLHSNIIRKRYGSIGIDWEEMLDLNFDREGMLSGYIHFPTSNKIYNIVVAAQDGGGIGGGALNAHVTLSIEEL